MCTHTSKLIPVKVSALTVFCPSLPLSAAAARAATLAVRGIERETGDKTHFNEGALDLGDPPFAV